MAKDDIKTQYKINIENLKEAKWAETSYGEVE